MSILLTRCILPRVLVTMACFIAIVICNDALNYYSSLANGTHLTPSYSAQWWQAPYTHAALAPREKHEYWTLNAIGSECWHVREIPVGSVVFWTALERQGVAASPCSQAHN